MAEKLTAFLSARDVIRQEDTELYEFGFQAGLEFMSCLFASVFLALLLGRVTDCLLFLAIFIPARSYAGGFHFERFGYCFVCSCLLIAAVAAAAGRLKIAPVSAFIGSALFAAAIGVFPSARNENRSVSRSEQQAFRKILCGILSVDLVVAGIFLAVRRERYLTVELLTLASVFLSMAVSRIEQKRKEKK